MKPAKVLARITDGAVANVSFDDLVSLLLALDFKEIGGSGSHQVFGHAGVVELVNLQEDRGQAKPYQVRQVATLVQRYDLTLESET